MLVRGVNRPVATEFSFLVGVPTMLAAGGYKIFKALRHTPDATPEDWGMLALCTVVSGIVSFLAVKWLLRYVQTHSFAGFGWYRIVFGACLLLLFFSQG
jgi:undecaprenyl-diphosphatase